jgi:hypothetical protein
VTLEPRVEVPCSTASGSWTRGDGSLLLQLPIAYAGSCAADGLARHVPLRSPRAPRKSPSRASQKASRVRPSPKRGLC